MKRRAWGWRLAAIVAGVALAVGLTACGDDDEGINPNVQYVTNEQHPYGQAVNAFIETFNSADSGITLVGQPSNPTPEPDLIDQLASGDVDIATISAAVWDTKGVTAFQALQAPFLVTNYDLERQILNGPIGAAMIERANEQNPDIVFLAIHEGGLRKPLGRDKALTSPADFNGTTIRAVQSSILSTGLRALGANPDPIPLPQVFQALESGTVDGMEANLGLIAGQQYYEVAQFVTWNVNFWPFPTILAMNRDAYESLSAEQQEALQDAAGTIDDASLDVVSASSTLPQALVNCGIEFVNASAADRAALEAAGGTAVAELSEETQDFVAQIQALKDQQPAGAAPPAPPAEADGECALGG